MSQPDLRRIGLITATLLVVANMIGVGVFTTTGFLIADIASAPAVIAAWLIGGLLALCGALTYGELGAAFPRNGGEYQLLTRIYHPAIGFTAGWISLIVGFSAPIAAAAIAFSKYLAALVPGIPHTAAALVLIGLLSALHASHVVLGGKVQNVFTILKVGLVLALIAGGIFAGDFSRVVAGERGFAEAVFSPALAVGLIYISFAYSGWNGAAYIAGELRQPARNLPLALIIGTATVVLLYIGVNLAILAAAPAGELASKEEVGHVAAIALFGEVAGRGLSAVITLALISSVSAMIMAGPRVYSAMGEDHRRLALLSRRTRRGAPVFAVALQAVVAAILVLSARFDVLLKFIGFTLILSAALTALGVIILRLREPQLERPYRTWGYPYTTALFLALSAWMVWHLVASEPNIALAGGGVIASGLVLYALVRQRKVPGNFSPGLES